VKTLKGEEGRIKPIDIHEFRDKVDHIFDPKVSAKVNGIQIVIPEKMLEKELHYFQGTMHECMSEYAVRTYLIRKPETIADDLELIGINARFYKYKEYPVIEKSGEADLVFKNSDTYYLVETKRYWKFKAGWKQILRAVECFKSEMQMNKQKYNEAIAVLVTTDPFSEDVKKELAEKVLE